MQILEGLNREQEMAVRHFDGPLLILAGAGSGKTRVITCRAAYLIREYRVNPWNILALTFTNKAANEMRERVDRLVGAGADDIFVGTFHSCCVRILRRHIDALGYKNNFTIYDADDQKTLMREILKSLQIDNKQIREKSVLNAISRAKDELITENAYEDSAKGDYTREIYARCYREYERRKKKANALDFDDIILNTIRLLEENAEILKYYNNRYRYIMVDEYQDTNTAQFSLIQLLANSTDESGKVSHNLCVVGDDDQSIYKFRGANIYNILNFESAYPEAKVIRLEENYRSTKNILDAANAVIKNNTERKEKTLRTNKKPGDTLNFAQYEDEYEEADACAQTIENAVNFHQASYSDFAVLYRTNAQSRVFEEKLIRSNIPYRIVGAVNFYQRREIKDILAYLRTIDNGADDVSVRRIINVPKRGIGTTTVERVANCAAANSLSFYDALKMSAEIDGISKGSAAKLNAFVNLIESLRQKLTKPSYTLKDLFDDLADKTGYLSLLSAEETPEAKNRLENIEELKNKIVAYELENKDAANLSGFLEEVSLIADIDTVEEQNDTVLLMTLHSAKGLEFPCVFLVGMEEGIFPGYAATDAQNLEELEEERRLMYVGITRAKEKLYLSCARTRFRNGKQEFNPPSRFVEEIPRYLMHMDAPNVNLNRYPSQDSNSFVFSGKKSVESDYRTKKNTPVSFDAGSKINRADSFDTHSLFTGNPMIKKGMGNVTKKQNETDLSYHVGDSVSHQLFGEGTVTEVKKVQGDYRITIRFADDITRKMMASFAKLEKL